MNRISKTPVRRPKARVGSEGIVDVAQRLFAEHGIENVSLRQVAIEAGLSNPFSVQYHFGDRQGLVSAIYAARLPEIDAYRANLLAKLEASQTCLTLEQLLDCLCRPFKAKFRDYARFVAWVMRSPEQRTARGDLDHLAPTTRKLYKRINGMLLHLPQDVADYRLTVAYAMVLDILAEPERMAPETLLSAGADRLYAEGLAIALGCLQAPAAAS